MNLIAALLFAALAIAFGLLGTAGKIALAAANPIAVSLAFLGCTIAAISFFVRYSKGRRPAERSGTGAQPMFWTWVSRISSVVGLAAGLLSFGRQLLEMFAGAG
jgi:hypothetical protein